MTDKSAERIIVIVTLLYVYEGVNNEDNVVDSAATCE